MLTNTESKLINQFDAYIRVMEAGRRKPSQILITANQLKLVQSIVKKGGTQITESDYRGIPLKVTL